MIEKITENVWDYPRPPRIEKTTEPLRVLYQGKVIAETEEGYRVLETSHPPTYYFPPEDIQMEYLVSSTRRTHCEWKGEAHYYSVCVDGRESVDAAWYYPEPTKEFNAIANYVAFYPGRMDACFVADELVSPQEGDFYGGWITSNIEGQKKGASGTEWW